MRPLSDTIARLSALRAGHANPEGNASGRLQQLSAFGSNPGALDAWCYVPAHADAGAPLVVVLHGCTQNAAGYDAGSGWSQLADEQGFAVLYPQQRRSNNANLCFNWYEPGDRQRGGGEPLSIVQMVEAMVAANGLDPARIFVTGLSAGGAMASVMLATYPEIFAGGGIIAGLPYGVATGIPEALSRMRGHGMPTDAALAKAVRDASSPGGRVPAISLWHGTVDHVVVPANADASLSQWLAIHGLGSAPSSIEQVDGHTRRIWRDAEGRALVEDYRIARMGHGTPLAATGKDACGKAGPHMLEAGISSTRRLAAFWELAKPAALEPAPHTERATASPVTSAGSVQALANNKPRPAKKPIFARILEPELPSERTPGTSGVGKIIEDALRAAGLMR